MLDFWNDLKAAVRGATRAGRSVEEVNSRLRAIFKEVRLDALEDGIVGALPVLHGDAIERFGDGDLCVLGPGDRYDATDRTAPEGSPIVVFADGTEEVAPPSRTLLLFKEGTDSHVLRRYLQGAIATRLARAAGTNTIRGTGRS